MFGFAREDDSDCATGTARLLYRAVGAWAPVVCARGRQGECTRAVQRRPLAAIMDAKAWSNLQALMSTKRPMDFGRPGIYEVFILVLASLLVSFVFWSAALYGAYIGYGTPSVVAVCMESALDCVSTILVLYRFASPDALASTPRNVALERRTSAWLALSSVALAVLLSGFAIYELIKFAADGAAELSIEVMLSVPSALLYLVIGMMQLQCSQILRLRSLRQDAIISILGSLVSIGTLLAAVTNLSVHSMDESRMQLDAGRTYRGTAIKWTLDHPFRFWWLDEVFTLLTALILGAYGAQQLIQDMRHGVRWWEKKFWFDPLPGEDEQWGSSTDSGRASPRAVATDGGTPEAGNSPMKTEASESTPLYPRV